MATPIFTEQVLQERLEARFSPDYLKIKDFSLLHQGHLPEAAQGGTHIHVEMVSAHFEGKARVARHRLAQEALKDALASQIHALTLSLWTPSEWQQKHASAC